MSQIRNNKRKARRVVLIVAILLFTVLAVSSFLYVQDYYHASKEAVTTAEADGKIENNYLTFGDDSADTGLIFYPGGKVEYTSYAPLMEKISEQGIFCVLLKMPCNLAVLDMNAAEKVPAEFPEISHWCLGGHSLGGAMAASFVGKHTGDYEGLVLLAAYSTADITDSGLSVISMYGSEDGVLNMDKYENYSSNLPADTITCVIPGGCHSYFGDYGMQEGDGVPEITRQEQMKIVAEQISDMIKENRS